MTRPTLIVVSGPPGAGKTTLAFALARLVSCPVISRDEIREGVVHAGTADPGLRNTYEIFAATVAGLIRAGVTVVAEAAFQDRVWQPVLTPLLGAADVRVIRCALPAAVARARIGARAARPAHPGTPVDADAWVPIALPVPTLTVETGDGWAPGIPEIIAWLGTGRT